MVYDCGPDTSASWRFQRGPGRGPVTARGPSSGPPAAGRPRSQPERRQQHQRQRHLRGRRRAAATAPGAPETRPSITPSPSPRQPSAPAASAGRSTTAGSRWAMPPSTPTSVRLLGGSLYSLTDLLASSLPAGDTLTKAVSINDNGVVAAQGRSQRQRRLLLPHLSPDLARRRQFRRPSRYQRLDNRVSNFGRIAGGESARRAISSATAGWTSTT